MTKKIEVIISNRGRKAKPLNVGKVKNQLNAIGSSQISIEDYIDKAGNKGHSYFPCVFSNSSSKKEDFLSGSILVADIDNKHSDSKSIFTPHQALERLTEYGIDVNAIYRTFSDTEPTKLSEPNKLNQVQRYRLVFVLDRNYGAKDYEILLKQGIQKLFPEADRLGINTVYYGGKGVIYSNHDFILSSEKLLQAGCEHSSSNIRTPGARVKKIRKTLELAAPILVNSKNGLNNADCNNILLQLAIKNPIRNFDWEHAREEFNLLDEFLGLKRKIYHNELRGLYSSMRKIEGGKSLWNKSIKNNPNIDDSKIQHIGTWIEGYIKKGRPYYEERISNYASDDKAAENYKFLSDIQFNRLYEAQKIGNDSLKPLKLKDAEWALNFIFNDIISEKGNGVHILKCAAGLGKTEQLMTANLSECIIATPTHNLKRDLSERLTKAGIDHNVIEELPPDLPKMIIKKYNAYLSIGAYSNASAFLWSLTSLIKGDFDLSTTEATNISNSLKKYFKSIETALNDSLPFLTTHKRIITMAANKFENHSTLIIDEDITELLGEVKSIPMKTIRILSDKLSEEKFSQLKEFLKQLLKVSEDKEKKGKEFNPQKLLRKISSSISDLSINALLDFGITGDILSLSRAKQMRFEPIDYKDPSGEKKLHFIVRNVLPKNLQTIIMSATANESIYNKLFGRVEFHDLSQVELKGKGVQYSNRGFGKSSALGKHNVAKLTEVAKHVGHKPVITYKSDRIKKYFENSFRHFGDIEGIDSLKGKDIAVVGTPHKPKFFYLLWASLLNVKYDQNNTDLKYRIVKYNGYKFKFMTFEERELQKIQFHFIESELIQAVGRARMVRESATVELFSNFPLPLFEQRNLKELRSPNAENGKVIRLESISGSLSNGEIDSMYYINPVSGSLAS